MAEPACRAWSDWARTHPEHIEGPRARHGQLDRPKLAQQPVPLAAVASIRLAETGRALEMLVDQLVYRAFKGSIEVRRAPAQ
jgi:hypothetical protein